MPSKQRVLEDIDKITKTQIPLNLVKHLVTSVNQEKDPPNYLKKGDVYITCGGSPKSRPCVVVKISEDTVYGIPLSTTMDDLNLCESKSRFFGEGYFSKSIICTKQSYVLEHFAGVYDNPKLLNKAIKLLKEEINTI